MAELRQLEPSGMLSRQLLYRSRGAQGGAGAVSDLVKRIEDEQSLLKRLEHEVSALDERLEALVGRLQAWTAARGERFREALASPSSVGANFPALARAAAHARGQLLASEQSNWLYRRSAESEAMFRRYGDMMLVVELLGVLDLFHDLLLLGHNVGKSPEKARAEAVQCGELTRLSEALWMPEDARVKLKALAEEFEKGGWDRLQSLQIRYALDDIAGTCLQRMRDKLSDRVIAGTPSKEAVLTRIHVKHITEPRYARVRESLLGVRVPLGLALSSPLTFVDEEVAEVPEDGRLLFDDSTVYLERPAAQGECERVPVLRFGNLSGDDAELLREVLADPDFASRLSPLRGVAAELLAAEVEPGRPWRLWRDAMRRVSGELLLMLCFFQHEANLMPEHSPPFEEASGDAQRRMDEKEPRDEPTLDWEWGDLDIWRGLVGPRIERVRGGG